MSLFQYKFLTKQNIKFEVKTLFPQVCANLYRISLRQFKRHLYRASGRKKGSYTIEASVALPLYLAFAVCILFFIKILIVGWGIDNAMTEAVDTIALSADEPSVYAAELLFHEKLIAGGVDTGIIEGGRLGINLLESSMDGKSITLCASYRVKLPFKMITGRALWIYQKKSARIWNGYDPHELMEDESYVYVTPYGRAYHRSLSCPYINPSISGVNLSGVSGKRNNSGGRYSLCPMCGDECGDIVYITTWGDCYHGNINCSGLKRTINHIKESEAGGRYHPCPKCGA